jgi:hypothetical protein
MAPQGMNMDSKKEREQHEDAQEEAFERPVMKMPEEFNAPAEEDTQEQNQEDLNQETQNAEE